MLNCVNKNKYYMMASNISTSQLVFHGKAIVYPEHDTSGRPTHQLYAYTISNFVMPAFRSQQYSGLSTIQCIVCCPLPNTNCNCNNCVYILCVPALVSRHPVTAATAIQCCFRY